jgi:oligopeptide/dipeptide ABC transporter ATP-binding protein
VILITHDLAVVADFCDRVVVMYGGRVMESGPVEEVLSDPAHPYTAALLASIPRIDRPVVGELRAIPGAPPDLSRPLPGCPFAPRCPVAMDQCRSQEPPWGRLTPDRWVACHRVPVDVRQGEFA